MATRALIIGVPHPNIPDAAGEAEAFAHWLRGSRPGDVDIDLRTTAETTSSTSLVRSVVDLVQRGAGKTSEFYFYFAGHGATVIGNDRIDPVLLTSDFTTPEDSGRCVLLLDELQAMLMRALGPAKHYYFIDACRYPVHGHAFNPVGLGLAFRPCPTGSAECWHKLYSAGVDALASGDGRFAAALLRGLRGEGTRERVGDAVGVKFGRLAQRLKEHVGATSDGSGCEGVLITGLENPQLTLHVDGAAPAHRYAVELFSSRPLHREEFAGDRHKLSVQPGDYWLAVHALHGPQPILVHQGQLSLFGDQTVALAPTRDLVDVSLSAASNPVMRLILSESITPLEVVPSPAPGPSTDFHAAIRSAVPGLHFGSELDPGMWLAALAAARGHPDDACAGIRLLCVYEDRTALPRVRLHDTGPWTDLAPHPAVPEVFVAQLDADVGQWTLSVRSPAGPLVRVVVRVVPGRATLVTLQPDRSSTGLAIYQHLLDAASDPHQLASSWRVQRDFARNRALIRGGALDRGLAAHLGEDTWDPRLALIAAFEALRRGLPLNAPSVRSAVDRLLAECSDWADVAALVRRHAGPTAPGLPVLTEASTLLSPPPLAPTGRWVHDQVWATWLQIGPPHATNPE